MLAAKLHGIRNANLHYHGSITLDSDQCKEAGILPMEFVRSGTGTRVARIFDLCNFWRNRLALSCLNGATARTCQVGDQIIVCRSTYVDEMQAVRLRSEILTLDHNNHIIERMTYSVTLDGAERYFFEIRGGAGDMKPMPLRTTESN